MTEHEPEIVIRMQGISKSFGSVQALNNVDLELQRGEVLGLVGDNAAGKSTLMKILVGAVVPDQGQIYVGDKPVVFQNPRDSRSYGIEMIYQDLALFNNMDVAANVFTGRELTRRVLGVNFLDKRAMHRQTETFLRNMRINISSPDLLVEKMSGGQRQMIAVTRATSFDANILIMDEPGAALGVRENATLLQLIAHLRDQGHSIIMITHRLPDLLQVGDRVMVLKGGERQGVLNVKDSTLGDIEGLIVRGKSTPSGQEANP